VDSTSGSIRCYSPSGTQLGPTDFDAGDIKDVWMFNHGGSFVDDACLIQGTSTYPGVYFTYVYNFQDTAFTNYFEHTFGGYYQCTSPYGWERLFAAQVRAIEPDASGDTFWILKDPANSLLQDYYGSRWTLTCSPIVYADSYFGSGYQSDLDQCWQDAQDLTRDSSNHLLVLDKLSTGMGRIKAFDGSSWGGGFEGGINLPDDYSATPIKLDSSDWIDPLNGNLLFVLHGDSSNGYFLSIYYEDEVPW
jgi:hypothetical protein